MTFLHLTKVAASSSNLQVVVLHVNCCVVCVVFSPLVTRGAGNPINQRVVIGVGVTIWARQVERAGVQTVNLARVGMEGGQSRQPVTMETIIKGDASVCYGPDRINL